MNMNKCAKALGILIIYLLFFPLQVLSLDRQAIFPTSFAEVADYVKKHHQLPGNFITKRDARRLGWDPARGNLWDVVPGKSIGGDVFHNRERKLPNKRGRVWYEADIHYNGRSLQDVHKDRMMKEIVFDASQVESMDQLHAELARRLDFPAHYGRNLDALYDCLSGEMALPLKIIWKNYRSTRLRLGKDIAKIRKVMKDFSREEPDFVIEIE